MKITGSAMAPLGTQFFVALMSLIWWAWPSKVGVVEEFRTHLHAHKIEPPPPQYTNPGYGPVLCKAMIHDFCHVYESCDRGKDKYTRVSRLRATRGALERSKSLSR